MAPNFNLQELLGQPREALDIEIKEWLNLSDANQRADLAKSIIAMANHGGGYVVLGLQEDGAGQFAPHPARPANLNGLSQDAVQDCVQKYLDPPVQCRVDLVEHPDGHGLFPIVAVLGGHRVPIKARAGSPDGKLVHNRTYIRRPGPRSEEPQSAADWDQLFDRIIRARQAEMVDAVRDMISQAMQPPGNDD